MAICIRSSWFFHKDNSWCIDTFMGVVSPSKLVGRQFSFSTDMLVLWVPSVTKSWSVKNVDAKEAPDNYEVIWHLLDGFAFQRWDFQILMWIPSFRCQFKAAFAIVFFWYFHRSCTFLYCVFSVRPCSRVLTLDEIIEREESFRGMIRLMIGHWFLFVRSIEADSAKPEFWWRFLFYFLLAMRILPLQ